MGFLIGFTVCDMFLNHVILKQQPQIKTRTWTIVYVLDRMLFLRGCKRWRKLNSWTVVDILGVFWASGWGACWKAEHSVSVASIMYHYYMSSSATAQMQVCWRHLAKRHLFYRAEGIVLGLQGTWLKWSKSKWPKVKNTPAVIIEADMRSIETFFVQRTFLIYPSTAINATTPSLSAAFPLIICLFRVAAGARRWDSALQSFHSSKDLCYRGTRME